jgi:hypothetical protein
MNIVQALDDPTLDEDEDYIAELEDRIEQLRAQLKETVR